MISVISPYKGVKVYLRERDGDSSLSVNVNLALGDHSYTFKHTQHNAGNTGSAVTAKLSLLN